MQDIRISGGRSAAVGLLALFSAGAAPADDLGYIRIFDQDYRLQRFDYNAQVIFPDARSTGRTCRLWSAMGAMFDPGRNVLIVASNNQHFTPPYSYKNYIVEIRVNVTDQNTVSGLSYQRTILAGDSTTMGYDLDPRGVTINPTQEGLGANGNLVVSTANSWLRAFDMATGEPITWIPSPDNGFSISTPNSSTDDVAFVPDMNSFFTVWRSPASAVTIFNRFGRIGPAFFAGRGRNPVNLGYPAGMAMLDPYPNFPRLFDYQPAVMVSTDDRGPSLEIYDTQSRLIAREAFSSRLGPGTKTLPLRASSSELFFNAIAADRNSGRLFLFHRGGEVGATDVFIFTPIPIPCKADYNADGFLDFFDYDDFLLGYESGDPRADINEDGFIDFFDYDDFITDFETGC
jgi:hypothetical protein